jgi:hypothetical protein
MIEQHCPLLLQSFVPPSEQYIDDFDNEGFINVIEDPSHSFININFKGFAIDYILAARIYQIGRDIGALSRFDIRTPLSRAI